MPDPTKAIDLHCAPYSADDFRRLRDQLDVAITAEVERLRVDAASRDLDRRAIRAAFDDAGFTGNYFGLDFEAPLKQFVRELQHVHQEVVPAYISIYDAIPGGQIQASDLEPA